MELCQDLKSGTRNRLGILFVIVLFVIDLVRCALIGYSTSAPTTKCPPNASLNKLLASTPALILSMYYYIILTLLKKLKRKFRFRFFGSRHQSVHTPSPATILWLNHDPAALRTVVGNDYIPGLYVKSSWNPPHINDGNTELAMMAFANRIEALVNATQRRRRSNLTPQQHA